jgi:uncharacterized protein YndB with AHSA1/START domain
MTDGRAAAMNETTTERISDTELVVTRRFDAPAHLIYRAWTTPDLLLRWWAPPSFGITFLSCEADVRTGGNYRFVFGHPDFEQPMAFVGRYLEVVANERIVWTNEESPDGSVTTLTLTETEGRTLLMLRDVYPTKAALDEAMESGAVGGYPEQFNQLDGMLDGMA